MCHMVAVNQTVQGQGGGAEVFLVTAISVSRMLICKYQQDWSGLIQVDQSDVKLCIDYWLIDVDMMLWWVELRM